MTSINDLITKYSSGFPPAVNRTPAAKKNVIVTGTTGSLGYYLLVSLLRDSQIGTVYCLNRSGEAEEKFWKQYRQRADRVNVLPGKLKFFKAAFGDDLFGLGKEQYDELVKEVDVILHNAWKVNWRDDVQKYESQIRGLHTFICLSLSSSRRPSIYFVSSVGSANVNPPNKIVREVVPTNLENIVPMGYTQSKFVSENILNNARLEHDLNANVLRVGQIAGPVTDKLGVWAPKEWFPAVMTTSKNMGLIPDSLNAFEVDWIPVDSVADIIVEIINSTSGPTPSRFSVNGAAVFNIVNPVDVPFKNLTTAIRTYMAGDARVVSFAHWLEEFSKLDKNEPGALQKYPALRIPGLWQKVQKVGSKYEISNALAASKSLRQLPAISGNMTRTWLKH